MLVALLLEIGLVLVLIPWSAFWDRNYFGDALPAIHQLMTNNYLRGAITGLGLVNVWVALLELADLVAGRPGGIATSPPPR